MKTQNISPLSISVFAFVVFFGAASVISAWTGPTVTPPSANISTPVNLTSTSQVKSGGFWASAIGSTAGYCINGSCISSWPVFPWTPNANGVSYMG
ncbi:hypothetical protein HYT05_01045, partial [Candidatus Kaiserbacteria bacterium]|nr:hypothetical protein [Candidatus Kaiserbacteria bacterium]